MSEPKFLKVQIDEGCQVPTRAHEGDAGFDLYSPESFVIKKGRSVLVDTGVHVWLPKGYAGQIMARSGMNVKRGIVCTGLIDAGYTGSIKVKLYNLSQTDQMIQAGDRIAQMIITPVLTPELYEVEDLDETSDRGDAGIGSTGS